MTKNRHFKLEADAPDGAMRFISDVVDAKSLAENKTIWVTITRTGKFHDPRYGEFEITRNMLLSMVSNFDKDAYGQKIFLDVAHDPSNGAAGEFKQLMVSGNRLRGEVEFTEYGIDAIKKKRMIYLSAEFMDNFVDNEQRKQHGPTLLGAALTPRPVIKHLDPVQLAESSLDGVPTYLDTKITKQLNEEGIRTMKKLLEELRKALGKFNLAEAIITQLMHTFESVGKNIADEEMQRTLMSEFVTQGKLLAEQMKTAGNADGMTLNFDTSGLEKLLSEQKKDDTGLSADDVKKLLAEHTKENAKTLAEQKQKLDTNISAFNKAIDDSDALKSLSEDQMKVVKAAADMITCDMTDEQVTKLAENQIAAGNQMAVSNQLSGMGFGATGIVHVPPGKSNEILSLQEAINTSLKDTSHFAMGKIKLAEQGKEHPFVKQVLAVFDTMQAPRLFAESKMLANGEVGTSDTNLPAGFQRTVIIEALSDLRVLNLVNTMTDPNATVTTEIPYETRDTSQVLNDGIVYEGGAIPRAGVAQAMDIAYILPMKVGLLLSNEVMHFSRTSAINWNAYSRNVESNARYVRELIVRRICNELQRSADAYGAVAVTGEAFDAQLTGSNSLLKTTNYPIVRPHQQRDLQGNAIGSVENPVAIVLNGTTISEYDGSNNQSAGTYYTITNYNLGYIQLVSQLGAPVTPADTGTNTLGYSYATNVIKFDLDNGSVDTGKHLNGLLRAFGTQKALLAQDRFVTPDFMLMSYTLNNTASNADAFEAQAKRSGTDTNNDGDLEMIKSIPSFSTNAPGINMGDERAIIGQRGTMSYSIAKPFVTGESFEATDSNGNAIGKKQAYGEEYSAIKVPTPIRNRLTSVVAYSFTGR